MLIGELESRGLLVDYCDAFIRCLDSHSEGTHSLQKIHWWVSEVIELSKSVPMKKQTDLHLGQLKGKYTEISKAMLLGGITGNKQQ